VVARTSRESRSICRTKGRHGNAHRQHHRARFPKGRAAKLCCKAFYRRTAIKVNDLIDVHQCVVANQRKQVPERIACRMDV
jgi:hypothetical protein